MRKLRSHVHVQDEHGKPHVFGPDDRVPAWAANKITNPRAWADNPGDDSDGDSPAEVDELRAQLAAMTARAEAAEARLADLGEEPAAGSERLKPPPKAGAGSSRDAWAEYAVGCEVVVPDGATREQIWQALADAGVPTE